MRLSLAMVQVVAGDADADDCGRWPTGSDSVLADLAPVSATAVIPAHGEPAARPRVAGPVKPPVLKPHTRSRAARHGAGGAGATDAGHWACAARWHLNRVQVGRGRAGIFSSIH